MLKTRVFSPAMPFANQHNSIVRLTLFILSHALIRNAHNGIFHMAMSDNFRVIRFFILRRRKGYIYKKRDI